jgi:hypothetical protein
MASRADKFKRPVAARSYRRILIVCEGKKTEPNYFKAFPDKPEVHDPLDIRGTGYNTLSLVEETLRLNGDAKKQGCLYSEIWCVFDKDSFSDDIFNQALQLAENHKIHCAYSIEAFEIWYLLHYIYTDTGLSRSQYAEKLSKLLDKTYLKNDPEMYKLLTPKQETAIKNAKRLYSQQYGQPLKLQNPITTVFQLVERLNG